MGRFSENQVIMINFYFPEFYHTHNINKRLIDLFMRVPEYFYSNIRIAGFYGTFPGMAWGGGRFISGNKINTQSVKNIVDAYNIKNIACIFTCTNLLIDKEHLNDAYCNMVLHCSENGINEVTVVSSILEKYIRYTYPQYKINSSTCKHITDIEDTNIELEKDYNRVVLNYNYNNHYNLLKDIKYKEKCEILLNPWCVPNCTNRETHYRNISIQHLLQAGYENKDYVNFQCKFVYSLKQSFYTTLRHTTHISPTSLYSTYIELGFTQFKIECRALSTYNIIESIVYYLTLPEYRDIIRLELLHTLS